MLLKKISTSFLVISLTNVFAASANEEEAVVILSSADAHAKYRVSVPPDPVHASQISASQQKAWEKVLEQCAPIKTRGELSESCESALSEYFPTEPVWDNKMYYYQKRRGLETLYRLASGLSYGRDRMSDLPYSAADFLDDYPVWSDIFDGNIERRIEIFLEVLNDPTCKALISRRSVGIQENLASRCEAEELFKYALYLDACSSAINRHYILSQEDPESLPLTLENESPTTYDLSLQFIRREIEREDDRKIAKRRMQKGYLLAYWTMQQCESHGYVFIPGLTVWHWRSPSQTETADQSLLEWGHSWSWHEKELLGRTYKHTLTISAKSGYEWAIQTYDLNSVSGQSFRAELRHKYPILVHRWLGRKTGKTDLHRQHRAKAYLLLKEKAGEVIAQLEYDSVDLASEIQLIEDGGELSYPSTWGKLPKEHSR